MNIEVAVAVILDKQQRILITQRPVHVPHGGYWEFPGGKLEMDESSDNALLREIKEEVGLDILQYHFLGEVNYTYPNKTVKLFVFLVSHYFGTPRCLEGQSDMKWIHRNELNPTDFPEANRQIIPMLKNYFS